MYNNTLSSGYILKSNSYNYKIEKVLGQGAFGITYLAKVELQGGLGNLDTNTLVTIKEFFMKEINGREGTTVTSSTNSKGGLFYEYKEKFAREAKNLSKLKHPNIVNVMEYFEANNTCYYVMEYLSGGDLDSLIEKRCGLSEEETIKYTKQIGSALSFMHQNNMLHLDLKPRNVMLNSKGDAILIDFGLSKQYDKSGEPESSTTVGRGTPGYASLEQANYQDGHGFPVTMDVYALGATMFKMLTGKRAPEASVILNDGFPQKNLRGLKLSEEMISIIEMAMAPMKKNRLQTVEEVLIALNMIEIKENDETTEYIIEPEFEDISVEEDINNSPSSQQIKCVRFSKETIKDEQIEESVLYTVNQKSLTIDYTYSKGKSNRRTTKITKAKWDRMLSILNSLTLKQHELTCTRGRRNMMALKLSLYNSDNLQKSNLISSQDYEIDISYSYQVEYEWNRIESIIWTVDNEISQWIESCKKKAIAALNSGPLFQEKDEKSLINNGIKMLIVNIKDGGFGYTYQINEKRCELSFRHKDFTTTYYYDSINPCYFQDALKKIVDCNYYRVPFKKPRTYPSKFLEVKLMADTYYSYFSTPYKYIYIGVRNGVIEEGNIKSTYNEVLLNIKDLPYYKNLLDACEKAEANKRIEKSDGRATMSSTSKTANRDSKKDPESSSNIVSSICRFLKSLK